MRSNAKKYWALKCLILFGAICITCLPVIAEDANAPPAEDVNAAPVAPPAGDVNKPADSSLPGYGKDLSVSVSAGPSLEGRPGEQGPSRGEERAPFEQRMQKPISVEFRNTPIEDVIRIMAQQADIDVIKSPAVTGTATVTLRNVPLEEALNNILAAHGYSYVMSQNMIRVITAAEKTEKAEPLQTRTFEIVYADVKEVVKALDKFKSKQGTVASIEGTSHIIVTDTESRIRDITIFIEKVDHMTPQILIEARIYDIKNTESFDIGTNWYIGRNTPITEVGKQKTHSRNDTTTGPTDTWERTVTETVSDPPDTETDKTVTTTTTTQKPETTGYGIEDTDEITKTTADTWHLGADESPLPYRKSKPYMGGLFDKEDGGTLRFGVLNDAVDIDLALSILHKQVGAKLLANPRILVLDNETANIKIIREIPYQQLTEASGGGTMGTTAWKEVGVELQVTPHVAIRDEMVRLHLKPKFSIEGEKVTVAGISYPEPTVDSREADTKLLVKNGQTVVLGGLRKRETTQDIRKVPLLGDLPVFGNLFRSESEDTIDSELVVFITVWIVKQQPVMSQSEQDIYHVTTFRGPKPSFTGAETGEKGK
jgi:type IV pilus assembly protein PilQ